MTDLRKAAEMALYALEFNYPLIEDYGNKEQLDTHHEAIMALHKSLAQPEQEPINKMPTKIFGPNLEEILNAAGFYRQPEQELVHINCPSCLHSFSIVPVAKREWVGLTDDEKQAAYLKIDTWSACVDFIEKKLKEKNT